MSGRIQIQSNLSLLEKDLKDGFIDRSEYDMLYSKYLAYLDNHVAQAADALLGKLMSSYYTSRYEDRKAKASNRNPDDIVLDEVKSKEELKLDQEQKKESFEDMKRRMYLESMERKNKAKKEHKAIKDKYDGLYGGVNKNLVRAARNYSGAAKDAYLNTKEEEST